MKRYFLCLFLCLFIAQISSAQGPVRDWGSYFSGQLTNPMDIAYDTVGGYIYVVGYTADDTGIATAGAHKAEFGDVEPPIVPLFLSLWRSDVFLSKFDLAGNRVWSTYIGGDDTESYCRIALDPWGNVYIAGCTRSMDGIASPGAFLTTKAIDTSLVPFLMKFDAEGNKLWGTYYDSLSTTWSKFGVGLAVDGEGNVYLSGGSESSSGIATAGTFQPEYTGPAGFLAKFNPTGSRLWATYVGGNTESITVDLEGYVYVGGAAAADNLGTAGTYQPTLPLGNKSSYIMKLHPNTGQRVWGTYIGSSDTLGSISLQALAADTLGYIYASGFAHRTNDVATSGVHQDTIAGSFDAFLMKLDVATGNRIWGTLYGGELYDVEPGANMSGAEPLSTSRHSLEVTPDGSKIFIGGRTASETGIAFEPCDLEMISDHKRNFLAEFDSLGRLNWGTYYDERINAFTIAVMNSKQINIYLTTRTNIPGLGTSGTHRPEMGDGLLSSGFIASLRTNCAGLDAELTYDGGILTATDIYTRYRWYHNGELLEESMSPHFTPVGDGVYYYEGWVCGCIYISNEISIGSSIAEGEVGIELQVYPNPVGEELFIEVPEGVFGTVGIRITDLSGRTSVVLHRDAQITEPISTKSLVPGLYVVELMHDQGIYRSKFVKQ